MQKITSVIALAALALTAVADHARADTTGDAVVKALRDDGKLQDQEGSAWSDTWGNTLDAVVQSPPLDHWGQAALLPPTPCKRWSKDCNTSLNLQTCTLETAAKVCAGGMASCIALDAARVDPDTAPARVCAGHSDKVLLDPIWQLITSATSTIDITTLATPDPRFLGTLGNAIGYLSRTTKTPITVRVIIGPFPTMYAKASDVMKAMLADFKPKAPIKIYIGWYQPSRSGGWNHSKIVAVDGKAALVGGHNMYDWAYLDAKAAHDLSIRVTGPAALGAQLFVNKLWDYTCRSVTNKVAGDFGILSNVDSDDEACPAKVLAPAELGQANDKARVIALGRMSFVVSDAVDKGGDANPADAALLAMIDSAKTEIDMSQQGIALPLALPIGPLLSVGVPERLVGAKPIELGNRIVEHLAARLVDGVKVKIVVAPPKGKPSGYGGPSPGDVVKRIASAVAQRQPTADQAARFCDSLSVASLAFAAPLAKGKLPNLGNHAKLLMIDRKAFYVGSQNLYPYDASEFGFLVDNEAATKTLIDQYWTPVEKYSLFVATTPRSLELDLCAGKDED